MPFFLDGAERHYLANLVNRDLRDFVGPAMAWRRALAERLTQPVVTRSASDMALDLAQNIARDGILSCNCGGTCEGCTAGQLVDVMAAAEAEAAAESAKAPYLAVNVVMQDTVESRVAFMERMRAYHDRIRAAGGTVEQGVGPDEFIVTMPPGVAMPL